MFHYARQVRLATPFLVLCLSLPALAQVEINQTSAQNGSVMPGDGPGFPVTISRAGSYVLASNLTVSNVNTNVIEITARDVTIDLNGFRIKGPVVCSLPSLPGQAVNGAGIRCSPSGGGRGIFSENFGATVINGNVRGMGQEGILLGSDSRVENITASSNGNAGIRVGDRSIVRDNRASFNGGSGIVASGMISGNTVEVNRGDGISGSGSVMGNASANNGNAGIRGATLASENSVHDNVGIGLVLGNAAGYSNNDISFNNGSGFDKVTPQVMGGIDLGQNVCDFDTICQ